MFRRALHLVLPAPCLACKEPVWETRGSLGLCEVCRRRLVRWPDRACAVCGEPLAGASLPAGYRCGSCRKRSPPYDGLLSVWSYQPPLDSVLMGLKFQRLEYLGSQLGRAAAKLLGPRLAGENGPRPTLVVSLPLYWWRHLRRGYNQADVVARSLAAELDLPVARLLRRRRATPPQSRLGRRARRKNLERAFLLRTPVRCRGQRILLVDDVVTTGATLEAAARCLRRGGAESITALTIARTPDPSASSKPASNADGRHRQGMLLGGPFG